MQHAYVALFKVVLLFTKKLADIQTIYFYFVSKSYMYQIWTDGPKAFVFPSIRNISVKYLL